MLAVVFTIADLLLMLLDQLPVLIPAHGRDVKSSTELGDFDFLTRELRR